MKATLVIIEKSPAGAIALRKAKELGYYVIFLGSLAYSNRLLESEMAFVDEFYEVDSNNMDQVLTTVKKIALRKKIDGIFTFMEFYVETCAKLCEELKLNGISLSVAELCRNKYKMRNFLSKEGINVPQYTLFSTDKELKKICKGFNFPNIIKPINMAGSRGVFKNETEEDLLKNFKGLEQISPLFGVRKNNEFLLESYIKGEEFSVEAISYHGEVTVVSITKKIVHNGKFFVEIGHISPAKLEKVIEEKITNYTILTLKKLGVTNSASHTELKIDESGNITIVEVAARLGGGHIPEIISNALTVDLWEVAMQIAVDVKPILNKKQHCYCCIVYVFGSKGIVENFELFPLKEGITLVEDHTNITKGMEVKELTCSSDRLGYLILSSQSYEDLYEYCVKPSLLYSITII